MTFHIRGLENEAFAPLFQMDEASLAALGAKRVVADAPDMYPCRIALQRVEEGEELLLLNHAHQTTPTSPYRSAGPIFVSRSAKTGSYRGELPPMLRDRLLSLRAYDANAFIVDAEVGEGEEVLRLIERFLANPDVAHVDAHFARRGCFAARIERA
ncbi:DUF1203 domain-containing protein [Microvirga splendida]|uniref:DUF1203 domain-containing protein n=1 Tax=Microvirga splendida TaxID=2795727 RepID=A0ABS0XXX9_9HYPH|nr:DUF1203 domain-containing protein [Microvirga splendida]MBJ6124879.1 DUF1203 domain-containing protein [Microvirga splendida]